MTRIVEPTDPPSELDSVSYPVLPDRGERRFTLRRRLILIGVFAVLLALAISITALLGLRLVDRAQDKASSIRTVEDYQQDADHMHDAIHADVLSAVLSATQGRVLGETDVEANLAHHVAQLRGDLAHTAGVPPSLAGELATVTRSLQAYVSQAQTLTQTAARDGHAALPELPAFERSFRQLESAQVALTSHLATEVARAEASARHLESVFPRVVIGVSAGTLAVMLVLLYFLWRLGTRNTALIDRIWHTATELTQTNARLQDAQRMAHLGSWETPELGHPATFSDELCRILGREPQRSPVPPDTLLDHVHPDDRGRLLEESKGAFADGDAFEAEYRIVRNDGKIRDVHSRAIVRRDADGERIGYAGFLQDVTDQRAVERMKDEFVSVISHELRTPLTSIRGALGLLAGGAVGPLTEKAQRMADVAVASSERLVRLINDILDAEKMASGKLTLRLASCSASELVESAAAEMSAMATSAGVTLRVGAVDGVVWADPDRIEQTLTNLISNAVKFSQPGGAVTVGASRSGNWVAFTVADQGRGIPEDQLDAVFNRFQQVDASDARERGGTGLGLTICKGIVEQHGGRIWVDSRAGEGATFRFTLPAEYVAESDLVQPVGDNGRARSVLICDDDPAVVDVLATLLETNGYRTVRAYSGAEALEQARDQRPAVIVLDLLMPGLSGWDTITELRKDPGTAQIPVIILSVIGPDEGEDTGTGTGAAQWLSKSADLEQLLDAVRRVLTPDRVPTVLIVEDDAALGQVLSAVFARHGANPVLAATGRDAVEASISTPPDLVVLDLSLPDIDGSAVIDVLRRDPRLRAVTLVVYTGADLDEVDRVRLRLGETRFFAKGEISPDEFERQVLGLLDRVVAEAA